MAIVKDDMKEDSMHSPLQNTLKSYLDNETLSPEDVAWADSCLNKDVDASDTNWNSFKDALWEILSSQSEPHANFSGAQSSMDLTVDDTFSSRANLASVKFNSDEDEDLIDEDLIDEDDIEEVESIDISEDDEEDLIFSNKRSRMKGKKHNNVFRPNYSEHLKEEIRDNGLSSNSITYEVDTSFESIFKVWDLGISDELDDFTKQLNKALDDGPSQIQSNPSDDSVVLKDQMNVSIDDLISGIGDLSLKQNT